MNSIAEAIAMRVRCFVSLDGLPSIRVFAFALILGLPKVCHADEVLQGFDAEVESALKAFGIPGAAIGVVQDGKVLLAKGYGVIEAGGNVAVDADTIFPIASMSKSFTAAVIASQVDEGELNWDVPVREYLPWFRMHDPVATELVTLRDMVAHRSGLARHDFIRMSTYLDRADLVRRIRHLPSNRTFREVFQYNNLMYVAAGYLSGSAADSSWESLVRERVFRPLGMSRSSTSIQELAGHGNHARAHALDENGEAKPGDFYDYQRFGIGPNGAVNSTVTDMLRYLQMYLDEGRSRNGERVLSPQQVEELLRPIVINAIGGTEMSSYALGWFVGRRNNEVMASHGGSIDGFTSHMALLPDRRTGVVVLSNLGTTFPSMISLRLIDRLMGVDDGGFEARLAQRMASRRHRPEKTRPERTEGAPPSHALSEYVGTWRHPAYGDIRVELMDGGLRVKFDAGAFRLIHRHYDTFRMQEDGWQDDEDKLVTFRLDEGGRVAQMLLPLEPATAPFVFTRALDLPRLGSRPLVRQ